MLHPPLSNVQKAGCRTLESVFYNSRTYVYFKIDNIKTILYKYMYILYLAILTSFTINIRL